MASRSNEPAPDLPPAPPDETVVVDEKRIRRIDWSVVSDALMGMFNAERGFWFTIRGFARDPREAFRGYVGEDRLRYSNPLKMVIFLSALTAFVMHQLQAYQLVQLGGVVEMTPEAERAARFVSRNYNLLILTALPLSAFLTRVFYWRRVYNWLEHLTLNAFQVSMITLVYFVMLPAIVIWPVTNLVYSAVALIYQVWLYRRVLGPGWFRAIAATVVVTLVYYGVIGMVTAKLVPLL